MLAWADRVMNRRGGELVLAAPQPAVARVLKSADARQLVPPAARQQASS
jgi:anti-anti-sigma regulatory factor